MERCNSSISINSIITAHYRKIFAILIVLFFVLYIVMLPGDYVWTDESYTIALIKHSFSEIWIITAADVHPPLYYFMLKIFTAVFGYNLIAAKLFSILPYIFVLGFGGQQIGKYFGKNAGILFMILFFAFPFTMSYATEIRMYSLAAAFVFGNAVFAYKAFYNSKLRDWIGFTAFGVAAAYTHYFAFVSICVTYAIVLITIIIKKRNIWWQWCLAFIFSIMIYFPWLSSFIEQLEYKVNNEYWIGQITPSTIVWYAIDLFSAAGITLFPLFFAGSYLVLLLYILLRKKSNNRVICILCLTVPVVTIIVGIGASIAIRPVFVLRYIVPSIPVLVSFMAIALSELKQEALVCIILTIALMGGISQYAALFHSNLSLENYAPVEKYKSVECYVSEDENCHMPNTLAYYEENKPIYAGTTMGLANPWKNRLGLNEFNLNNVDSFIYLTGEDIDVPPKYLRQFNCKNIGDWTVEYENIKAYLLTKK